MLVTIAYNLTFSNNSHSSGTGQVHLLSIMGEELFPLNVITVHRLKVPTVSTHLIIC